MRIEQRGRSTRSGNSYGGGFSGDNSSIQSYNGGKRNNFQGGARQDACVLEFKKMEEPEVKFLKDSRIKLDKS